MGDRVETATKSSPLVESSALAGQGTQSTVTLQDNLPTTIIEARRGWKLADVDEIWRFRELFYFLTWRDIKVRYKQTVLGAAWAVIKPLATMFVFALFLGRINGIAPANLPYPLFVFAGTLTWSLFSNACTSAAQSVVGSRNLVTKVYFPRLIIPLSSVGAGLVDFVIALAIFGLMMIGYGFLPTWQIALVPFICLMMIVASLGVGILLSALTVAYRDFGYVLAFGMQLWMFATPCIFMDVDQLLGPRSQALMPLNPAYGLIYNFRQAMLGLPMDWNGLLISSAVSIVLLLVGLAYFRRVETRFADII